MSEYIMGLGISVKICKLYDDLVSLVLADSEFCPEFNKKVLELEELIDKENDVYNKLDEDNVYKFYNNLNGIDMTNLDSIKNRYYSKIKERMNVIDGSNDSDYPFSLETAIMGKILLDTIKKIEYDINLNINDNDKDSIYNLLYSFHKSYKYTLISMNSFLERLAIDFNFNISLIPDISFDKIKDNFDCNSKFYNYLDNVLLIISIDIFKNISDNKDNLDITSIYSNLLSITELDIITSYLSNKSLNKLLDYINSFSINLSNNDKIIKKLVVNKICGDNCGKSVR